MIKGSKAQELAEREVRNAWLKEQVLAGIPYPVIQEAYQEAFGPISQSAIKMKAKRYGWKHNVTTQVVRNAIESTDLSQIGVSQCDDGLTVERITRPKEYELARSASRVVAEARVAHAISKQMDAAESVYKDSEELSKELHRTLQEYGRDGALSTAMLKDVATAGEKIARMRQYAVEMARKVMGLDRPDADNPEQNVTQIAVVINNPHGTLQSAVK